MNHAFNWRKLIGQLTNEPITTLLLNKELAERIKTKIPHATMAKLIQMRPSVVKNITGDHPLKGYFKSLLKNREFMKLLRREYIVDVLEAKSIRELLDREVIGAALRVHPDLPAHLGMWPLSSLHK